MAQIYLKEASDSAAGLQMICYHCGEKCSEEIIFEDKKFCCIGCLSVYKILNENNLCEYYNIERNPGVSFKSSIKENTVYKWLDDVSAERKFLTYNDGKIKIAVFFIPSIHCSSCIWLLENLHKLNDNIVSSEVNFLSKTLRVKFSSGLKLSGLVSLLAKVGYKPDISFENIDNTNRKTKDKSIYYRLGVAGFCFGNIMIISFPEYLSVNGELENYFRSLFGALNIILAIPVFFYSAYPYFDSALRALRARSINIDFPVSIGLFVLFFRSVYEIITNSGSGFMDSLSGLIFFLLIGKAFQQKTYDSLNFERTYKSYFPAGVIVKNGNNESNITLNSLKKGDRIIIRNNEIIPADSILFQGEARIDYSFVTGESLPVLKMPGEIIYAGGRQTGGVIELEVIKPVNQSYLTSLWNNESLKKSDEGKFDSIVNLAGKYFTVLILIISAVAFFYWYFIHNDLRVAINAFTAVLIIACPCGIALSSPFALGNALRILGRFGFYAKNASVIEKMSVIDTIVFDKTGTITKTGDTDISYKGDQLSDYELKLIRSVVLNSSHPLSRILSKKLGDKKDVVETFEFREYSGKGSQGIVEGHQVKIGSLSFVSGSSEQVFSHPVTSVFISIDGKIKGAFYINNVYRENIDRVMKKLGREYDLLLLSGDNQSEGRNLLKYFKEENMFFNQTPHDKVNKIEYLKNSGKKILMFGDGLNDAAAMKVSDVSVAVTENDMKFTPSSDVIMQANVFPELHNIIKYARSVKTIIFAGFTLSAFYNIAGIIIAFNYVVTPLMAAVLMPLASISAVVFVTSLTSLKARKEGLF